VLLLLTRRIYGVQHSDGFRWHKLHKPNFTKIDTGCQVILRFRLRNLRAYIVGITDGKELFNAPLKLTAVI
jgi:hypothetical protein